MTETIQQLLTSFDALPDADKQQAAVEILRRVPLTAEGELSEESLVEAADELFRALDTVEVEAPPPIGASRFDLVRSLLKVGMLSVVALIFEVAGIWCLVFLWFTLVEMIPTGRLFASHQETMLAKQYVMAWCCCSFASILAILSLDYIAQHRWFSKVLLMVAISLPVVGYVFMFSIYDETALVGHYIPEYYLISWGCFSMAFVFAVLGRKLATRHRWFFKALLIVTIEVPLAGYVFLYSLPYWAV